MSQNPNISLAATFFGYTGGGERQFGDFRLGTQPAVLASRYNLGLSLNLDGSLFLQPRVVGAQERATRAEIEGASAGLVDTVTRAYLAALQADEELEQALAEVARTQAYVGQARGTGSRGSCNPARHSACRDAGGPG